MTDLQLDSPLQPLSEKQMVQAKKRWPRNNKCITHKLKGSGSFNDLITELENHIPEQYREYARITVERVRDDNYSPCLEVYYYQDETEEDWEERVTIAFRLDQQRQREYKKQQDEKDIKEYARLKAKLEGKKAW